MKIAVCPRCNKDGIKIGNTPLPDGNGIMEQYKCLSCDHGFMLSPDSAAPLTNSTLSELPKLRGVI